MDLTTKIIDLLRSGKETKALGPMEYGRDGKPVKPKTALEKVVGPVETPTERRMRELGL